MRKKDNYNYTAHIMLILTWTWSTEGRKTRKYKIYKKFLHMAMKKEIEYAWEL